MRRKTGRGAAIFAALLVCGTCAKADIFDRLDDALTIRAFGGAFQTRLTGLVDLEGYYVDQPPPGLIETSDRLLFDPRLSFFLQSSFGSHFCSFVQARVDRGFDPENEAIRFRADEYLLRYISDSEGRLNFQVGKFATVVGNWVARHDSWSNPFVTAPLPYENIMAVSDEEAPSSPMDFLGQRYQSSEKYERVPIIWGPDYTSGASLFGQLGKFSYAFEFKNAALSARPESWDATDMGWKYPSEAGRIGYSPNEAWSLGVSSSVGDYLREEALPTLPPGKSLGDYKEITFGEDLSYAWRHLQVWAEAFETRFQVPFAGNADTLAYYVEAKYKMTAQLFGALRWNQQLFGTVPDGEGGSKTWDNDIWRIDTALGYRFSAHLQGKVQYSIMQLTGTVPPNEQLVAIQFTLKF